MIRNDMSEMPKTSCVNFLSLFLYGWDSALTFQQTKCEIIKKVPQKGKKEKDGGVLSIVIILKQGCFSGTTSVSESTVTLNQIPFTFIITLWLVYLS